MENAEVGENVSEVVTWKKAIFKVWNDKDMLVKGARGGWKILTILNFISPVRILLKLNISV